VTAALERRYRRLLALYPTAHRDEYGEEMLAVLMARAEAGQRRPRMGEAVDLARCALGARVGGFVGGLADARWRNAAAVVGVVLPMLLLALRLRGSINSAGVSLAIDQGVRVTHGAWVAWAGGWVLVVLAVALGLPRVAAVLAWLGVLVEAVLLAAGYPSDPTRLVQGSWLFVLAIVAAAALSVPAPRRHGYAILGRRRTALVALGACGFAFAGLLDLFALQTDTYDGITHATLPTSGYLLGNYVSVGLPVALTYLVSAALVLAALARLDRSVRRRVVALLLPALTQYLLVRFTFGGFIASSPRFFPTPVLLNWPQWLALALTPVLAFVVGAAAVQRAERRERLIALGREREREVRTEGPAE
jgi:hypothetical protein